MSQSKTDISIVVPLHNEEGNIEELWRQVSEVIPQLEGSVELVLVNDGSTDRTGELLDELAGRESQVRVVELDGNWGQASAFCAGFEVARGDIILTMDGDLQNDPADFPKALAKIREGYQAVTGWRKNRQERFWDRKLPSICANILISLATGVRVHDNGCGLKAYRAEIVKGTYLPRGFNRFMPAIFGVRPQELAEIVANDRKRHAGATHYGLKRVFIVFKDLLVVHAILNAPVTKYGFYQFVRACSASLLLFVFLWTLMGNSGRYAWLLLPLAILFGVSSLIVPNLRRWLDTQETKGFRIARIIGGERTADAPQQKKETKCPE